MEESTFNYPQPQSEGATTDGATNKVEPQGTSIVKWEPIPIKECVIVDGEVIRMCKYVRPRMQRVAPHLAKPCGEEADETGYCEFHRMLFGVVNMIGDGINAYVDERLAEIEATCQCSRHKAMSGEL